MITGNTLPRGAHLKLVAFFKARCFSDDRQKVVNTPQIERGVAKHRDCWNQLMYREVHEPSIYGNNGEGAGEKIKSIHESWRLLPRQALVNQLPDRKALLGLP